MMLNPSILSYIYVTLSREVAYVVTHSTYMYRCKAYSSLGMTVIELDIHTDTKSENITPLIPCAGVIRRYIARLIQFVP